MVYIAPFKTVAFLKSIFKISQAVWKRWWGLCELLEHLYLLIVIKRHTHTHILIQINYLLKLNLNFYYIQTLLPNIRITAPPKKKNTIKSFKI